MRLQSAIDAALQGMPTAVQFAQRLTDAGVTVRANVASTGRMNGFSFELGGIAFKGSDLGKTYTWQGLQSRGYRMNKLEMLKGLPDGGLAEKVQTAVELSSLVGQLGQDMASLTEETRRTMVQGQKVADRIERTILKAEGLLQRLESWVPPQSEPVIHEAPIWPMLATGAASWGWSLSVCVTAVGRMADLAAPASASANPVPTRNAGSARGGTAVDPEDRTARAVRRQVAWQWHAIKYEVGDPG
jgi:hypothetical protein